MIAKTPRPSRVLVVGAGVSGCAAAIRLAHHGHEVTLAERAEFPREKICGCCLGAAGMHALDAIGVGAPIRDLGESTHAFIAYLQTDRTRRGRCAKDANAQPVRLPIASGVAISRSTLDSLLVERAQRLGVRVWQPCEVQVIRSSTRSVLLRYRHRSNGGFALKEEPSTALESTRVEYRHGCSETGNEWHLTDEFDLVVLATGLTGVFSATKSFEDPDEFSLQTRRWILPWIDPPHGPLGIAAHLRPDDPLAKKLSLPSGEIHMVCGDDGYVGLVRLPNGVIDIAAALRSQRQRRDASDRDALKQNWNPSLVDRLAGLLSRHPLMSSDQGDGDAVMKSLEQWLNERATRMTAPPLRRRRVPGDGRVVAIGDCAGYVEPMTGEGMTWGIESGIAVADLWNQRSDPDHFALEWTHALKTLQPKRRRLCGGITWAMRSEVMRRMTLSSLRHAPWIAKPITRGLACGPTFEPTH